MSKSKESQKRFQFYRRGVPIDCVWPLDVSSGALFAGATAISELAAAAPPYAIGGMAMFWLIERLAAF